MSRHPLQWTCSFLAQIVQRIPQRDSNMFPLYLFNVSFKYIIIGEINEKYRKVILNVYQER
jgi:hypothetical protein